VAPLQRVSEEDDEKMSWVTCCCGLTGSECPTEEQARANWNRLQIRPERAADKPLQWERRENIAERCPSFGPLPCFLYFDSGVELAIHGVHMAMLSAPDIPRRATLTLPGTALDGGLSADLDMLKTLRAQLDAAIEWVEDRQ
jgi:hypothetical protein